MESYVGRQYKGLLFPALLQSVHEHCWLTKLYMSLPRGSLWGISESNKRNPNHFRVLFPLPEAENQAGAKLFPLNQIVPYPSRLASNDYPPQTEVNMVPRLKAFHHPLVCIKEAQYSCVC